jgi:hypothetical protein
MAPAARRCGTRHAIVINIQGKAEYFGKARQTIPLLAGQPSRGGFATAFQSGFRNKAEFKAGIPRRHRASQAINGIDRQAALDRGRQGQA